MTLHLKMKSERGADVVRCPRPRGRIRIDVGRGGQQLAWGCPGWHRHRHRADILWPGLPTVYVPSQRAPVINCWVVNPR